MERPKSARNWKHGLAHTKTYKIWAAMKGRCQNPNDKDYPGYGGRGITVCERWQSFENFYEDMGEKPIDRSIDRIENNLGYCKDNCRWATPTEQNNNSTNVHWIEFNGVKDTVVGWSRRLGCPSRVLNTRLSKEWPIQDVLSPPFDRNRTKRNTKRIECLGESLTIPEWSKKTNVPRNVISYRLSAGWPVEKALTAPIGTVHNKQQ